MGVEVEREHVGYGVQRVAAEIKQLSLGRCVGLILQSFQYGEHARGPFLEIGYDLSR
jgi:hypothetical protein